MPNGFGACEPNQVKIFGFRRGELFRSFLQSGNVDTVEVSVIPVLLGSGVPSCRLPTVLQNSRYGVTRPIAQEECR